MAQRPLDRREYGAYIDGEYAPADERFVVENPATEEPLADVASSNEADTERAIDAAARAVDPWQEWDPIDRSRLLYEIGDEIRDDLDRLAELETLETGRPISTSEFLVEEAAKYFEYYAGIADKIQGETVPLPGNKLDYTRHEPLGVTGHVVPWNAGLLLFGRSVAPALAAGNTAVVKPDSKAPLSMLAFGKVAAETDLPPGVLNVVAGDPIVGKTIVADERVSGLTFTGSVPVGKEIMRQAADRILPVCLELGGKSPSLVFPDADMDDAVEGTVNAFWNAGQICFNTTRVFVHEDVYEDFLDRVTEDVEDMTIGPGMEDPDIGPVISADARANVERYVAEATEDGATIPTGGHIPRDEGHYYAPTIVENVDDDAPISCEEVFGPVLTAYRFSSTEEVIRRANDTRYGLYAAVWTQDVDRAHNVAAEIEAGTVAVNEFPMSYPQAPFGGYEESGLGREKGVQAIEHYTQLKNVIVSLDEDRAK
jgi:aldehyde dehydrogenase (NAD+)